MRATITKPEQAWAMLAVLGVTTCEWLKGLHPDELRTIGKIIVWLADYEETKAAVKAQESK